MKTRTLSLVLLVIAVAMLAAPFTQAASVTPVLYTDWQSGDATSECQRVGYSYGFKVDPPSSGTYYPLGNSAYISVSTADGVYFNWSASFGIDVVIAKGGPGANVYLYNEALGDTVLNAPINPQNGNPAGLSHITFCWDYDPLGATKTANTSWTRTYTWDIVKSVDDNSHTGFTGDSFTSNYTVAVTQYVADSAWRVFGSITINNTNPIDVSFSVADSIDGIGSVGVVCPQSTVPAGGQVVCTYEVYPSGQYGTLNTATVTSNTAGVGGATATASVIWGAPNVVGSPTVTVNDTNGSSWSFSGTGQQTYSRTFTCDGDEGTLNNTATIYETGQSSSASVTVECYALSVTKDANTSLTRTWSWNIDKLADQSSLTLSVGQQFLVNYQVAVSATSADSDWAVEGTIWVHNPAPISAPINTVSDVVSSGIAATVDCGVAFPYSLAAGGTLTCTYDADLPDASARTNTASAVLQNSPGGSTEFTGTANVDFGSATVNHVDECIDVSDTYAGSLGTVCAGDAPRTFKYSRWIGPYDVCGDYTVDNTASFVTNDTGTTGSDSWTVNVHVPCGGCTLTQGYWKTHSNYGPAPYDDGWLAVGGPDAPFFASGMTWYQVFWTPPAGNAYYNLAHQYMAAKLNILNGASSTSAVDAAISGAETLFNAQGPGDTTLTNAERRTALGYASTLDRYNNGLIGPGHCSE